MHGPFTLDWIRSPLLRMRIEVGVCGWNVMQNQKKKSKNVFIFFQFIAGLFTHKTFKGNFAKKYADILHA